MTHDPEHGIGDAVALDCVAEAGRALDRAVGPVQPAAAKRFAHVLALGRLVGFVGLEAKVEDDPCEGTSRPFQSPGRVGPSLVPDIPAEAPPPLRAHPHRSLGPQDVWGELREWLQQRQVEVPDMLPIDPIS